VNSIVFWNRIRHITGWAIWNRKGLTKVHAAYITGKNDMRWLGW